MRTLGKTYSAVLVAVAVLLLFPSVAPAFAAPLHPGGFGIFVNPSGVPSGSKLIINIVYSVTNDEDSGFSGYWALDNYTKELQIWQAPDGTFYVVARYQGHWTTFAGALSPGNGVKETKIASGTFEGGYSGSFTGTLNPSPSYKTHGVMGAFDFGGTQSDIIKGSYSNDQTGDTSPFDWTSSYFTFFANFNYNWGWTYHYQSQTWNNFYYASSGDIVV